jgi:hypothetical protein
MHGYGKNYAVTALNSASGYIPCSSFYTVKAWRHGKVGYFPVTCLSLPVTGRKRLITVSLTVTKQAALNKGQGNCSREE